MGVTENAALKPNVKEGAVGFSVTYVRAKTGKGAALHRHATEEVFIPVKGRWQVFWLDGEEERTVESRRDQRSYRYLPRFQVSHRRTRRAPDGDQTRAAASRSGSSAGSLPGAVAATRET
jgi:hypothetical protein